jgi:hypothetical protein
MRLSSLGVVRRSLFVGAASLVVILVGLAVKSTASAPTKITTTTLYTGSAGLLAPNAFDDCEILNVSAVNHTVSVELLAPDGTVGNSHLNVVLAPGQGDSAPGGGGYFRCIFTIDGPASDVRADLLLVAPDGSVTAYIPAY